MDDPSQLVPEPGEYSPKLAPYVDAVGDRDPIGLLVVQTPTLRAACEGLDDSGALYRYAPGKWSVKEVVGHLTDAERVFSYRAMRIARGDATPLPGFDENAYVHAARFDAIPMADLLQGFAAVRDATLALFREIPEASWGSRGVASGAPISVRALAYVIAGHTQHHLALLAERYGLPVGIEASGSNELPATH